MSWILDIVKRSELLLGLALNKNDDDDDDDDDDDGGGEGGD